MSDTFYTRRHTNDMTIGFAGSFVVNQPGYVGYLVRMDKTKRIRIIFSYGEVRGMHLGLRVAHVNDTAKSSSKGYGIIIGMIKADPTAKVPASETVFTGTHQLTVDVDEVQRNTYFAH